jgi:hypothetical protein
VRAVSCPANLRSRTSVKPQKTGTLEKTERKGERGVPLGHVFHTSSFTLPIVVSGSKLIVRRLPETRRNVRNTCGDCGTTGSGAGCACGCGWGGGTGGTGGGGGSCSAAVGRDVMGSVLSGCGAGVTTGVVVSTRVKEEEVEAGWSASEGMSRSEDEGGEVVVMVGNGGCACLRYIPFRYRENAPWEFRNSG